jgi:hypothetical protein
VLSADAAFKYTRDTDEGCDPTGTADNIALLSTAIIHV